MTAPGPPRWRPRAPSTRPRARRCPCRRPSGAYCRSRRSARTRRLRWCRPAAPPPAGRTRATPPPVRPALEISWWSLLSSTFRGNDNDAIGAARAVLARGTCILQHFDPSDVGGRDIGERRGAGRARDAVDHDQWVVVAGVATDAAVAPDADLVGSIRQGRHLEPRHAAQQLFHATHARIGFARDDGGDRAGARRGVVRWRRRRPPTREAERDEEQPAAVSRHGRLSTPGS